MHDIMRHARLSCHPAESEPRTLIVHCQCNSLGKSLLLGHVGCCLLAQAEQCSLHMQMLLVPVAVLGRQVPHGMCIGPIYEPVPTLRYSLLNQLFAASGCPLISACCPAESSLAPVMVGRAPVTTRLPVWGTARVLRVAGSLLAGMEAKLGCNQHMACGEKAQRLCSMPQLALHSAYKKQLASPRGYATLPMLHGRAYR